MGSTDYKTLLRAETIISDIVNSRDPMVMTAQEVAVLRRIYVWASTIVWIHDGDASGERSKELVRLV